MFTNEQVKITKETILYKGFMSLTEINFDHALYQGGWQRGVKRELLQRDNAVGVLLYDPTLEEFILVEQLRVGALADEESPWLLEVVAGMVDPHENPEQVACRESCEEAGAKIKKLIPIQSYWVSPGGSNEKVDLFLGIVNANKVSEFAGLKEEHEDIKVCRVSKDQLLQKLMQGCINNAMALICIQWFFLNQKELQFD